MPQPAARWDAAKHAPGSTLVVFSSRGAFARSLGESPNLWGTAVRRGVDAGRRARAKRKRVLGKDGDEAAAVATPVAALLAPAKGDAADNDTEGKLLCEVLHQHLGIEIFQVRTLPGAEQAEPLPGPVGLLLVPPGRAQDALAELARQAEELGADRAGFQEGCVVVLMGLPPAGSVVLQGDGPPYGVLGLRRDEREKKDVLSIREWEGMEAAIRKGQGLGEVAGLAVPSLGAAAFYPDGCVEALQEPLVRLRLRNPPEVKVAKKATWDLLDTTNNAFKLPRGFAPHESPFIVAADWMAGGGVLAFTGAGISKESGVPTYRDGNGLWKRYDAMEVSSIAGFVGEPAKVWAFERDFNNLLRACKGANAGHRALAELEALGCVDMIVTQNVDGFHQAAGNHEVVELHGSEVHAVCLNKACGHRTDMRRIFGHTEGPDDAAEDLWSPPAKGWGLRWPEKPEDTALQRSVRQQLAELQERVLRRRTDSPSGTGGESGSESDKSAASSSSSSSSSSGHSLPRRSVLKPLTSEELALGCPAQSVPICPDCKEGILKPDGIFFGEPLVRAVLKKSLSQSLRSNVVLMVGTSGSVDPAAKLPLLAQVRNKAKVVEVNIGETRLSKHADIRLLGSAAEVLPRLQKLVAEHPRTAQLQALRKMKDKCIEKLDRQEFGSRAARDSPAVERSGMVEGQAEGAPLTTPRTQQSCAGAVS